MKRFSLSVLLLLASLTAQAGMVMVDGTVYDTGKGSHSGDSTVQDRTDSNHCWIASTANLIQHWQDEYLETVVPDPEKRAEIPDGYADTTYTRPSGTRYLEVYNTLSRNFTNDGANLIVAADWYFSGETYDLPGGATLVENAQPGAYMPDSGMTAGMWDVSLLVPVLNTAFSYSGYGVSLAITLPSGAGGHAITCWGYETDLSGQYLTALYITDSDDRMFGTRRLEIGVENNQTVLYSPYDASYYSNTTYVIAAAGFLCGVDEKGYIDMGDRERDSNAILSALPENGEIHGAVDIEGRKLSSSTGVSAEAGSIFASSGGASLTLRGQAAAGDGLTAKAGAMVVFQDTQVSVSGFAGNGLTVGCETYLMEGAVSITGNGGAGICVQGTAEDPNAFLQIIANRSVDVSGNEAGALCVAARTEAEIVYNDAVTFSGNKAGKEGAVVYNAGTLDISGNDAVTFSGNDATYDIYNDGKLILKAYDGQPVTFQHGIKNGGNGTATLGGDGAGTFAFKDDGHEVALTFDSATIGKNGAIVWDEDGALELSDVVFSGDVTFDLGYFADFNQLDLTGATFAEGSTISFILDLGSEAGKKTDFMFFGYPWQDMEESELTQVEISLGDYVSGFQAEDVNLALTVTGTIADDAMLIIDTEGFDLDRRNVYVPDCLYSRTEDGRILYNAPEPATATLTLLALAALAARRRRIRK